MKLQYPIARYNLQVLLLALADFDYQVALWIEADRSLVKEYIGFHITIESLLEDFIWNEGDKLVGAIFRSSQELQACLSLVGEIEGFLRKKARNLTDKEYIEDVDWLTVIGKARYALHVLNAPM